MPVTKCPRPRRHAAPPIVITPYLRTIHQSPAVIDTWCCDRPLARYSLLAVIGHLLRSGRLREAGCVQRPGWGCRHSRPCPIALALHCRPCTALPSLHCLAVPESELLAWARRRGGGQFRPRQWCSPGLAVGSGRVCTELHCCSATSDSSMSTDPLKSSLQACLL